MNSPIHHLNGQNIAELQVAIDGHHPRTVDGLMAHASHSSINSKRGMASILFGRLSLNSQIQSMTPQTIDGPLMVVVNGCYFLQLFGQCLGPPQGHLGWSLGSRTQTIGP